MIASKFGRTVQVSQPCVDVVRFTRSLQTEIRLREKEDVEELSFFFFYYEYIYRLIYVAVGAIRSC